MQRQPQDAPSIPDRNRPARAQNAPFVCPIYGQPADRDRLARRGTLGELWNGKTWQVLQAPAITH